MNIPSIFKKFLLSDSCQKNYRIVCEDGTELINNNIVEGSVNFTESICSGNKMRFGAGERSVFECELFDCESIQGQTISVYLEIIIDESMSHLIPAGTEGLEFKEDLMHEVYPIPLGVFVVESCKRKNNEPGFRRVVAYGIVDEIKMNERVQKAIEFATRYGYKYHFHPEVFAKCYANNDLSTFGHIGTTNSTIELINEQNDIPFIINSSDEYVRCDFVDFEVKKDEKGDVIAVAKMEQTIASDKPKKVGAYIINYTNIRVDKISVGNEYTLNLVGNFRKFGFVCNAGSEIKLTLSTGTTNHRLRLVYSSNMINNFEELQPIVLKTRKFVASIDMKVPATSEDGYIAYLSLKKGKEPQTMPSIVRAMNTYYYGNDLSNKMILKPEWNEYLQRIDNMCSELNETGRICNQCFEPFKVSDDPNYNDSNGLYYGFSFDIYETTKDIEPSEASYSELYNMYFNYDIEESSYTYFNQVQVTNGDILTSYEFRVKQINMISNILVEIPSDFNGDIRKFIADAYGSVAELCGAFYKQKRNGEFEFIKLSPGGLFPSDDLFPEDDLFPNGYFDTVGSVNLMNAFYDDFDITRYNQIDYSYRDEHGTYNMSCYGWTIERTESHVLYERMPIYSEYTVDVDFKYVGDIYIKAYDGTMTLIYENGFEETMTIENMRADYTARLYWKRNHGKYKNVKQIRFNFILTNWESLSSPVKIWQVEDIPAEPIKVYKMDNNKITDFIIPNYAELKNTIETTMFELKKIIYRPGTYTFIGRPDIESGDIIEIHVDRKVYGIPVLRRVLSGEQLLVDKIQIGE